MMVEDPYPFQRHLGFSITDWAEDTCTLEQPMLEHLGNRNGILHGGAIATLLDTSMGYAGCWTGTEQVRKTVTLSLNVNYIAQARGTIVRATGRKTGGGRKTFFAESRLTDEDGTLVASATGVFRYIS
ncbi:PaaI family thioesterase [Mesobacterium pallidum]|uniref:PaaI family thioesterase n=1 Tax=Mesobacterium pallidum TaxID=2872037 RepID=UPI001EE28634|nr:PaaI family thioesterase [Mesobacterium pallidum]